MTLHLSLSVVQQGKSSDSEGERVPFSACFVFVLREKVSATGYCSSKFFSLCASSAVLTGMLWEQSQWLCSFPAPLDPFRGYFCGGKGGLVSVMPALVLVTYTGVPGSPTPYFSAWVHWASDSLAHGDLF